MFNELKYHNGQAYVVKRKLPTHNFVFKNEQIEMRAVQMYMEHINCDHVLRDQSRGDTRYPTIQEYTLSILDRYKALAGGQE